MLLYSFQELADGKVAGKNYAEVRIDIFGFRSWQHIIFYRKLKDIRIEITRILHNRMDLKTECKNKPQLSCGFAASGAEGSRGSSFLLFRSI